MEIPLHLLYWSEQIPFPPLYSKSEMSAYLDELRTQNIRSVIIFPDKPSLNLYISIFKFTSIEWN